MRYVTSLPPITETPEIVQPEGLSRTNAVRPVRERLFPARIAEHYANPETVQANQEPHEKRERSGKERRNYCRRVMPAEPLLDTRAAVERRRKARRRDEPATAVDEKV